MRASDAFSWYMERDPALRSTVVVVAWLDRNPDWDLLVARLDRASRLIPSLRQRVVESPLAFAAPRWTYDRDFDLSWHIRRVTVSAPRSRDAVLEFARLAAMGSFDRDRPLWEVTLVEGVEGGGAAFVMKFHHSLSDGVGGMMMLPVIFDLKRKADDLGAMPPAPPGEIFGWREQLAGWASSTLAGSAAAAVRAGGSVVPALLRSARDPLGAVRGVTGMAGSVYRTAAPISDTKSPVMRDRAMTRRLAMLDVPLAALRAAAETVGGTVNDGYLAAMTGGLRRYHELHGVGVDKLRVTMPISIRSRGDATPGNRITLMRLTLPVAEADPAAQMRSLHSVTEAARHEPSLPVTNTIAGALNLLPAAYVGGVLKHVDFLASNVPGVQVPVYLAKSKVTELFAFGPTIGTALNATLVSYAGTCHIGLNIDTAAVPDPEVMIGCLRESLAELAALAGSPAGRA